jgi:hypothetical protein
VEWNWQGKTKGFGENPVPVPFCPPQIPHGLTRDRTRAYMVRGRNVLCMANRVTHLLYSIRFTVNTLTQLSHGVLYMVKNCGYDGGMNTEVRLVLNAVWSFRLGRSWQKYGLYMYLFPLYFFKFRLLVLFLFLIT